jgi:hypothetical protein
MLDTAAPCEGEKSAIQSADQLAEGRPMLPSSICVAVIELADSGTNVEA